MNLRQLLALCSTVFLGTFLSAQGQATATMGMPMPTPAEMKQMMQAQKPMLKDEAKREISTWDKNEDGELNMNEFKEMIDSSAEDMSEAMSSGMGMGGISMQMDLPELFEKAVAAMEDETKATEYEKVLKADFETFDEDDSDNLSVDELVEFQISIALTMMGLDEDSDEGESAEEAESESAEE